MPDDLAIWVNTRSIPRWDSRFCASLQQKPILCQHHVHENYAFGMHHHMGIEFLFCKSGSGLINMDGTLLPYSGPVLLHFEGQIPHSIYTTGLYERWNVCFEPGAMRASKTNANVLDSLSQLQCPTGIRIVPIAPTQVKRVESLFDEMTAELREHQTYYERITLLQLLELGCLCDRFARETDNAMMQRAAAGQIPDEQSFLTMQSYIEAKLGDNISAHSIATAFHYSEQHVYRLIRKLTGRSLGSYVKSLRIKRAQDLLIATDMPITLVGTTVGIKDPAQFSRDFRETVGYSPRDYRVLNKAGVNGLPSTRSQHIV